MKILIPYNYVPDILNEATMIKSIKLSSWITPANSSMANCKTQIDTTLPLSSLF